MLNSIPEKMDTAALLELPDALAEEGYSKVATGLPMRLPQALILERILRHEQDLQCRRLFSSIK